MEYFVYCRDRPGTLELREALGEEHWSFMDGYADAMIARGPTFAEDGATPTGSLHIVDLPDADAAQAFAHDEPYYRAGVFGDVMIRRFHNSLGRTMWEHGGDHDAVHHDAVHFLVIGHAGADVAAVGDDLYAARRAYLAERGRVDRVIVCGPLLSDDGSRWAGTAATLALESRAAVEELLAGDPLVSAGLYEQVEIHPWTFGGRR
jgi:uncharacterized protein